MHYEGRVHEQPVSELPRRRWPLCIGHDGYQTEQMVRKAGRNRRLLEQALHDTPNDAYLWYQLGKFVRHGLDGADAIVHKEHLTLAN